MLFFPPINGFPGFRRVVVRTRTWGLVYLPGEVYTFSRWYLPQGMFSICLKNKKNTKREREREMTFFLVDMQGGNGLSQVGRSFTVEKCYLPQLVMQLPWQHVRTSTWQGHDPTVTLCHATLLLCYQACVMHHRY